MYEISVREDFPEKVLEFIKKKEVTKHAVEFVRVHVTGDFYSIPYIDKWKRICKGAEGTVFRTTTRQIGFKDEIIELSSLPNMIIRESLDNPFSYEISNITMDEDGNWDFDVTEERGRLEPSMDLSFAAPDPAVNLELKDFKTLVEKLREFNMDHESLVSKIKDELLRYRLPILESAKALICSGQCQNCADPDYPFEGGYFCWREEGNTRYPSPIAKRIIKKLNRLTDKKDVEKIEDYVECLHT